MTSRRTVLTTGAAGLGALALGAGVPGSPAAAHRRPHHRPAASPGIRGADLSTLQQAQDLGARYFDQDGEEGGAMAILAAAGLNYVRLRIWVDPANGYNDKAAVLAFARQVKATGLGLLIDFHYSDTWADPGTQTAPAAWADFDLGRLAGAVHDYTYDVVSSLAAQGTAPDMVQIGNEINSGMLWPVGKLTGGDGGWNNLATLLNAGHDATKAASGATQVMLHIANGGKTGDCEWWFGEAAAFGVNFDVLGVSYYSYWSGTFDGLATTLASLTGTYHKPIVVAETAYPFTLDDADATTNSISSADQLTAGYPASEQGQRQNFRDVIDVVNAVPDGMGLGYFYWEPTWTAVPGLGWDPTDPDSGDGWDNQALFNHDGHALSGITNFGS